MDGSDIKVSTRPNRTFDDNVKSFFERDWPDWLTDNIYDLDGDDR
jgi:succinate dehydrogenase / fumarate reductase flavoprotein subunit